MNKLTQINDITTHNVIAWIKYSNLETEPYVMKKFKQNYQVQIRSVRNYKIQSKSIKKLQIRRIYIQIDVRLCFTQISVPAYGQRQSSHKLRWSYPGEFSRFHPASDLLKIVLSKPDCRRWCSCCIWEDCRWP